MDTTTVTTIENTRTLLAGDSGDTDEAAAKESKKDMNERIRAVFSSKPKDDSTSAVVEKESTVTATATGIANSRLPQPAAELHGNTRHVMDVTATPPPPAGTDTQTVDKHTSEMGAVPKPAAAVTQVAVKPTEGEAQPGRCSLCLSHFEV